MVIKACVPELKNTFTIEENRFVNYLDLQIQGDSQLKCHS